MTVSGSLSNCFIHISWCFTLTSSSFIPFTTQEINAEKAKLKSEYKKKNRELSRKYSQNEPYDTILRRAEIVRLRKELCDARNELSHCKGHDHHNLLNMAMATLESLSKQVSTDRLRQRSHTWPHTCSTTLGMMFYFVCTIYTAHSFHFDDNIILILIFCREVNMWMQKNKTKI